MPISESFFLGGGERRLPIFRRDCLKITFLSFHDGSSCCCLSSRLSLFLSFLPPSLLSDQVFEVKCSQYLLFLFFSTLPPPLSSLRGRILLLNMHSTISRQDYTLSCPTFERNSQPRESHKCFSNVRS